MKKILLLFFCFSCIVQATKDEDLSRLDRIMKEAQTLQIHSLLSHQKPGFSQLQSYIKEIKDIVLTLSSGIKNGKLMSSYSQWHKEKQQDPHFIQLHNAIPSLKKIFLETKQIQDNYSKDIEKNFLKSCEDENILSSLMRKAALEVRFKNRHEIFEKNRQTLTHKTNKIDEETP